ncbi:MAG: hypothetical protein IT342_22235 [Candidatus Melainabacteria bacterium]|nr:hypothetical protein [Candidatus Melainabacteria bacterium]
MAVETNPEVASISESCVAKTSQHVASEADLSQPQTLAQTPDTSGDALCSLELVDDSISNAALVEKAEVLKEVLRPDGFLLLPGEIDFRAVENIFRNMSADELRRFESVYDTLPDAPGLRADLQRLNSGVKLATIETMLSPQEGEANYAGNLAIALEAAKSGDTLGGELFRAMLNGMSTVELETARQQWLNGDYSRYGSSFDAAIVASSLSDSDKALFENYYIKGDDHRDATAIELAARALVEEFKDSPVFRPQDEALRRFQDIVNGDSPEAVAARAALLGDKGFVDEYNRVFGKTNMNARGTANSEDILRYGEVSTKTLIEQESNLLSRYLQGDKVDEHIEFMLEHVSPKERADFIAGRMLAASNPGSLTAEQEFQLKYFNDLNGAIDWHSGDARKAIVWKDLLENGKQTVVSDIAKKALDGNLNEQSLLASIEGMSEEDWARLKSVDGVPSTFKASLESAINKLMPDALPAISQKLTEMSEASEYAAATKTNREFADVITQNGGRNGDAFSVAEAVMNMSAEDAAKYASDPNFRKQIDDVVTPPIFDFIDYPLDRQEQGAMLLAQSMLEEVARTGKPPTGEQPIDILAKKWMNDEITEDNRLQALSTVMSDPAVFERLKAYHEARSNGTLSEDAYDYNLTNMVSALDPMGRSFQPMLEGGTISGFDQMMSPSGAVEGFSQYSQLVSDDMRDWELEHMSAQEKEIADFVIAQNGNTEPVDYARMYVLGIESGKEGFYGETTYEDYLKQLDNMSLEERQQFNTEYERKYKTSFVTDFVDHVAEHENLDEAHKTLFDKTISQNFDMTPADRVRLEVLSGNKNYQAFEQMLSEMSAVERTIMRNEYNTVYGADFDADFHEMIGQDEAQISKYTELLRAEPTDPIDQFLRRVATFDDTGVDYDSTREVAMRALLDNGELLAKYSAAREKLPADALAAIDAYFLESVENNRESKQAMADAVNSAINYALIIAAVATLAPSGGASTVALGALTAASRAEIVTSILGGGMVTQEQAEEMVESSLGEAALFLIPDAGIALVQGLKAAKAGGFLEALVRSTVADDYAEVMAAATTRKADDLADSSGLLGDVIPGRPEAPINGGSLESNFSSVSEIPSSSINQSELAKMFPEGLESGLADSTLVMPKRNITLPDETLRTVTQQVDQAPVIVPARTPTAEELAAINSTAGIVPVEMAQLTRAIDGLTPDELLAQGRAADGLTPDELLAQGKAADAVVPDEALPKGVLRSTAFDEAAVIARRAIAPAIVTKDGIEILANEEQSDFTPPVDDTHTPSDELMALSRVRRGEGPWQSAERILAAAGGTYDVMEVRALANAIKAVYAEDANNPDIAGLKVNHGFITEGNFERLLSTVSNDAVKTALMSFAS